MPADAETAETVKKAAVQEFGGTFLAYFVQAKKLSIKC